MWGFCFARTRLNPLSGQILNHDCVSVIVPWFTLLMEDFVNSRYQVTKLSARRNKFSINSRRPKIRSRSTKIIKNTNRILNFRRNNSSDGDFFEALWDNSSGGFLGLCKAKVWHCSDQDSKPAECACNVSMSMMVNLLNDSYWKQTHATCTAQHTDDWQRDRETRQRIDHNTVRKYHDACATTPVHACWRKKQQQRTGHMSRRNAT